MKNSLSDVIEMLRRQPGFLKHAKMDGDSVAAAFCIPGAPEPCLMLIEILTHQSLRVFIPEICRHTPHDAALRLAMVLTMRLHFGCFLVTPEACVVDYVCQVPCASRSRPATILGRLLVEALRAVSLAREMANELERAERDREKAEFIAKFLSENLPPSNPMMN